MRRLFFPILLISVSTLSAQTQKKILIVGNPGLASEIQAENPSAKVVSTTGADVLTQIVDADAFIGAISPEEVRAAKQLKWVGVMAAGVENVLFPKDGSRDLQKSNVILTNNKIVQGPEIADHALAMLLMLSRELYRLYSNDQKQVWDPRNYHGIELRGKTAVVIGVGGIGSQISLRANAFGMKVIGVDPEDKPFLPFIERVVKPDQLDEVIPLADVVFISTPDTPKSHKMMGPKEFDLMKKNSYFIAVSRGGIYDMPALVKAMDERKLAGAGVDVTDPEPLPANHPLWKFPNAVVTPHIAGRSDMDAGRMTGTIKDNAKRFIDGKPMLNVVDKSKGY